jgi:hypothetical protein
MALVHFEADGVKKPFEAQAEETFDALIQADSEIGDQTRLLPRRMR